MALKDYEETFEAVGYDVANDGESVGANDTLDEDYATSSVTGAPDGWGSKCLRCVRADDDDGNAYYDKDISDYTTFYLYFDLIVTSHGIANANAVYVIYTFNSGWSDSLGIMLYNDAGTLRLAVEINDDGTGNTYTSSTSISLDTPYKVELYFNAGSDEWAWKIDRVTQDSGALSGAHLDNISWMSVGLRGGTYAASVFMDNVTWGDTGWIGAQTHSLESALPSDGVQSASTVAAEVTRIKHGELTPTETSAVVSELEFPIIFLSTIAGELTVTSDLLMSLIMEAAPASVSSVTAGLRPSRGIASVIGSESTVAGSFANTLGMEASITGLSRVFEPLASGTVRRAKSFMAIHAVRRWGR